MYNFLNINYYKFNSANGLIINKDGTPVKVCVCGLYNKKLGKKHIMILIIQRKTFNFAKKIKTRFTRKKRRPMVVKNIFYLIISLKRNQRSSSRFAKSLNER